MSSPSRGARSLAVVGTALVVLGLSLGVALHPRGGTPPDTARPAAQQTTLPAVGHVFVINLENKNFRTTWGTGSAAPYLAKTLRAKGVLLTNYYGTAHHSLGNYLAQISGQAPTPAIQADCGTYTRFHETGAEVTPGQVVGNGCVYPAKVGTLARQLTDAGLSWRGYMQDMSRPCLHPALGSKDRTQRATARSQYATRHNPFVYFRSITGDAAYCKGHVRALSALSTDLKKTDTTRTLTYLTPDLCHDAHDATCADGGPGGLRAANGFLKTWVPKILHSPAFGQDGMLVITADESEQGSAACCGEVSGPNVDQGGIDGPGGGRVGALVISPFTTPGSTASATSYNHYSLLATIEDLFALDRLGYARTADAFGPDVFNAQ
jgi:hypothetical protein